MTKKRSKILVAVGVLMVLIVGITRIAMVVLDKEEETVKAASAVAVDTEFLQNGQLIIFKNGEFFHYNDVVSYVEGDPGCLYPKGSVIGEFIITNQSTGKTVAFAILEDGETAQLETQLHRLPLSNGSTYTAYDGGWGQVLVRPVNDTYSLTINPSEKTSRTIHSVIDYSVAYDTIYWMDSNNPSTVWSLDWTEDGAEPQMYIENAYGVSHHTDEAEGALVAYPQANYEAYGRHDIYSPYGDDKR